MDVNNPSHMIVTIEIVLAFKTPQIILNPSRSIQKTQPCGPSDSVPRGNQSGCKPQPKKPVSKPMEGTPFWFTSSHSWDENGIELLVVSPKNGINTIKIQFLVPFLSIPNNIIFSSVS